MSARHRRVAILMIAAVLAGAYGALGDGAIPTGVAHAAGSPQLRRVTAPRTAPAGTSRQAPNIAVDNQEPGIDPQQARCMDDWRQQLRQRREALASPTTADMAIEHALLTMELSFQPQYAGRGDTERELTTARMRWPDNVELAWLGAQQCTTEAACQAAWQHLASLEPDNAEVWLMAMAAAAQKHDEAAYEEALRAGAASHVYDPHHGLVFLHARAAMAGLPVPDSCQTPAQIASLRRELGRQPTAADWMDVDAVTMEGVASSEPFGGLRSCRASSHPSGVHREDCIALLSLVATGDTLLDRKLALHMLVDLNPGGVDGVQLRERYRRVSWLVQQTWFRQTIPEGEIARQWTQGEAATVLARAIAEGRWPPPAGWHPDDAAALRVLMHRQGPPGR